MNHASAAPCFWPQLAGRYAQAVSPRGAKQRSPVAGITAHVELGSGLQTRRSHQSAPPPAGHLDVQIDGFALSAIVAAAYACRGRTEIAISEGRRPARRQIQASRSIGRRGRRPAEMVRTPGASSRRKGGAGGGVPAQGSPRRKQTALRLSGGTCGWRNARTAPVGRRWNTAARLKSCIGPPRRPGRAEYPRKASRPPGVSRPG